MIMHFMLYINYAMSTFVGTKFVSSGLYNMSCDDGNMASTIGNSLISIYYFYILFISVSANIEVRIIVTRY